MSNILTQFKIGHEKSGGKKKGYVSPKKQLLKILNETTTLKDGEKITLQRAMLLKLIEKAIKKGDMGAIKLIMEYIEGKPKVTIDPIESPMPHPIRYANPSRKTIFSNELPPPIMGGLSI